jgi:hypothetical protein
VHDVVPPEVPPLEVAPGFPDVVPVPDVDGLPDVFPEPEVEGLPEELEVSAPAEPLSRTSWLPAPEHPTMHERHAHARTKEVRERRVMAALHIVAHAGDLASFLAGRPGYHRRAVISPTRPRRPPWV